MRRSISSLLTVTSALLFLTPSASSAQTKRAPRYAVTFNSFGPLKVGMTVAKASKALGVRLARDSDPTGEGDCYYVSPARGFKDVSFMVNGRRVARIDVSGRGYVTDRGAGVGDTEDRIKQLYKGMVKVGQHPYVDYGHYLEIRMKGKRYGIIFETDGKRVTSFRAGRQPAVGYIEGCS